MHVGVALEALKYYSLDEKNSGSSAI
jgi:hypothetical protein